MATTEKLDQDARYAVKGWDGIAFFIHGFPRVWEPYLTLVQDEDTGEEYETGDDFEGEWVAQDETCGRVIVVMVGDDTKREVDIEDLRKLGDLDYCASCGQIGCGHDGRDRD